MVTSRISYSLHCDIGHTHPAQERLIPVHEFSRLRVDAKRAAENSTMPALYVAMATWIPKCNMYTNNTAEKEVIPKEDAPMLISSDEEQPKDITSNEDSPKDKKEDESGDDSNEDSEDKSDDKEDLLKDMISKQITPKKITPKKVMSPMQIKKQEERIKLKLEREEQRKKEREEKEERRRKEREEKEEQKRKEREEKEEQKRKEKEEKDEQKRKEKEEKEEQKRKEKEEKDEQKRKEREEKEIKKLQELDGKNKEKKKKEELFLKEKVAFASFFRKSAGGSELKKPETELKQTLAFMPFQVKSDMRLAPVVRTNLSSDQKQALLDNITDQLETVLYLDELKKGKQLGSSDSTWPVLDDTDDIQILEDDEIQILEDSDIGEKVEEQPKAKKMRAKLLKFHENRRPAYFGTWRKTSQQITPRKPLAVDKEFFDYEVDSDDDWEEEEPGESLHGSDDEEKENDEKDDYEVDNEFFVPHGYLSDEEVEAEENCEVSAETQKEKLKILQEEFDEEMKSKTQKIKPRLIGCIWENKLIPKVQDAIHKFLEDRMMIITGTIQIQKRDILNTSIEVGGSKQFRKPLTKELIPEFLQLIHGNTKNKIFLVNEFHRYLSSKNLNKVSRASLLSHLRQFAKWKKCPDEGEMLNKHCWYVEEDVRSQYEVNLKLPNNWTYIGERQEESGAKKALAV